MKRNIPTPGKESEPKTIDGAEVGDVYTIEGGRWRANINDYTNGLRDALIVNVDDDKATFIPYSLDIEYLREVGRSNRTDGPTADDADPEKYEFVADGNGIVTTPEGDTWTIKRVEKDFKSDYVSIEK